MMECLAACNRRISETGTSCECLPWTSARKRQLVDLFGMSLGQGVATCEEGGQRVGATGRGRGRRPDRGAVKQSFSYDWDLH